MNSMTLIWYMCADIIRAWMHPICIQATSGEFYKQAGYKRADAVCQYFREKPAFEIHIYFQPLHIYVILFKLTALKNIPNLYLFIHRINLVFSFFPWHLPRQIRTQPMGTINWHVLHQRRIKEFLKVTLAVRVLKLKAMTCLLYQQDQVEKNNMQMRC